MIEYHRLLRDILARGAFKSDRTGTGTQSIFGATFRHDLSHGFPLLTTKRVHFKSVAYELLWMVSGSTNVRWLQDKGVTIWDEWADANGELGPVYGHQWRHWGPEGLDQLASVIERIKANPNCRRLIVTAWNPSDVSEMALPPCHLLFQFNVTDGRLSCQMYQRSADAFLGVPFNIASYALLTEMVAHVTRLKPGELTVCFGDVHIYNDHREQVCTQHERTPTRLPRLEFTRRVTDIDDFKYEDFRVVDYNPHPAIKAKVSV